MTKRKIIIIGTTLIFLLGLAASVFLVRQKQEIRKKAAPATTIYFEPSTQTIPLGEKVSFKVFVNTGVNNLYSVILEIKFDETIFDPWSLTFSPSLPDELRPPEYLDGGTFIGSAGTGFSGGVANPPLSGIQEIATIQLTAKSPSAGSQISFGSQTAAYTGSGEDIGVNLVADSVPATVVITGGEPTPTPIEPTATPTPTFVPEPTIEPQKGNLSFNVTLEGIVTPPGILELEVSLIKDGQKVSQVVQSSPTESGQFQARIYNFEPGLYDFVIDAPRHLSGKFSQVNIGQGDNQADWTSKVLLAGDISGPEGLPNNLIDIFDIALAVEEFDKTNSPADVDYDGKVTIFDITYIVANFDQRGEE